MRILVLPNAAAQPTPQAVGCSGMLGGTYSFDSMRDKIAFATPSLAINYLRCWSSGQSRQLIKRYQISKVQTNRSPNNPMVRMLVRFATGSSLRVSINVAFPCVKAHTS